MTIPGKRTIADLSLALIPARVHLVTAALVGLAFVGMTVLASILHHVASPWVAEKASRFADVFMVMPLWVLVGGVIGQFSNRLNTAIDDVKTYWGAE